MSTIESPNHLRPTKTIKSTLKDTSIPRTYDPDGLRRRAACLCFKDKQEKEVLLITSTHDQDKWVVPGGGIDPGEEPVTAAAREVVEEAGTVGVIDRLLDVFENTEKKTRTWVYVLYVEQMHEEWREDHRKRKWFGLPAAKEALSNHKPVQVRYFNSMRKDTKVLS